MKICRCGGTKWTCFINPDKMLVKREEKMWDGSIRLIMFRLKIVNNCLYYAKIKDNKLGEWQPMPKTCSRNILTRLDEHASECLEKEML